MAGGEEDHGKNVPSDEKAGIPHEWASTELPRRIQACLKDLVDFLEGNKDHPPPGYYHDLIKEARTLLWIAEKL